MQGCLTLTQGLTILLAIFLFIGVLIVIYVINFRKYVADFLKNRRKSHGGTGKESFELKEVVATEDPGEQAKTIERMKTQLTEQAIEKERLDKENRHLTQEIDKIQTRLTNLDTENERLKKEIYTSRASYQRLEADLRDARREKDVALTRLSQQASALMRNNNPNIVDLSDENRPTKIGERFSELYDNEWTEAFDSLGAVADDDRKETDLLLNILMSIYQICKDKYAEVCRSFRISGIEVPDDLQLELKGHWKKHASAVANQLKEAHLAAILEKVPVKDDRITAYAGLCVELCWLMCVQDPPMVLELEEEGAAFDSSTVRAYTQSGPDISHNVWPILRLHQGGPLVGKGIAQCWKRNTIVENTSF